MTYKHYKITKKNNNCNIVSIDYSKLSGFDITPKNSFSYDGVSVNKLIIIKQTFIEKVLKKKIKRKLEIYLKFIIEFIDNDSDDSGTLSEVLNDITRYKEIVNYRYRKHLGEKYIDLLLKKIELLEYELKVKLYTLEEKNISLKEEESIGHKSR